MGKECSRKESLSAAAQAEIVPATEDPVNVVALHETLDRPAGHQPARATRLSALLHRLHAEALANLAAGEALVARLRRPEPVRMSARAHEAA
jgi:hypothetical protein